MIEALIAYHLKTRAEDEGILPNGNYRGRPQNSTDETLIHLTTWSQNQRAKGRYVGTLFYVKAAFTTVKPVRSAHTLNKQGFQPPMVHLGLAYLSKRLTTLSFSNFESNQKSLTIGLPQGSPLSVILYILYNSSLLTQAADMC